jgi:predicted nucleic acid-binding protein
VGIQLCSTTFVRYECLHKPGRHWPERLELQKRLQAKLIAGRISFHAIDIEDLQDFEFLKNRKKLSTGELSVIVFACKTRQAVLTDDVAAQKLARTELGASLVQSTAHLFAWLYFNSHMGDSDKDQIIADLLALGRSLKNLDEFYTEAQRCRAMANQANRN